MTTPEPVSVFPANVITPIAIRLDQRLNGDGIPAEEHATVQTRPIHTLNAGKAVAVLPVDWSIAGDPEMGTFPRDSHPIQEYGIIVQCLVSDWSEESGISRLSLLSRRVRNTLISDRVLHQALRSLVCTEDETRERFHALRVLRQNFLVNDPDEATTALYLSTTEITVVTEVIGPV